jgi:tetratricopeptide (TPR) repeat protein
MGRLDPPSPARALGAAAPSGARRAVPTGALLAALAAYALLAGCAARGPSASGAMLLRGEHAAAVAALRAEEAERPADAVVKRNLGVALLESGDAKAAAAKLGEARALDPRDEGTLFFLGRAADAAGDPDLALEAYGAYLTRSKVGAAVVRQRLHALGIEKATRDVRQAIAREASLKAASIPENTLAVPDFTNVAASDTLGPLSRGLAAVLITDLSKVPQIRVLERERIRVLLDELGMGAGKRGDAGGAAGGGWAPIATARGVKERLAALFRPSTRAPYFGGAINDASDAAYVDAVRAFQTDQGLAADGIAGPRTRQALEVALEEAGLAPPPTATPAPRARSAGAVSESSAPRLGRLLGARRFAQGSFAPAGASDVQLGGALIDVPQGTVAPTGPPIIGPLVEVLRLEKELLRQILSTLGITLSPVERRTIDALPTDNFRAFLAYSRGLDFEDRGMTEQALASYREALRLDPGFGAARERAEIAAVTPAAGAALDRAALEGAASEHGGAGGGDGAGAPGVADRLIRTGTSVGMGPGPTFDRGGETDPTITTPSKLGDAVDRTDADIDVGGDLPRGKTP